MNESMLSVLCAKTAEIPTDDASHVKTIIFIWVEMYQYSIRY